MNWKSIVTLATEVKTYVEKNKKLPSKAGGLSQTEYMYILVKAVMFPHNSIVKLNIKEAPTPNGDSISKTLTRNEFTGIANDVNKFISKNQRLPNFISYQNKKININLAVYCFAKIVNFYGKNNRLPNTCEFNSNVFSKSSKTSTKYSTKGGTVCKKLASICKMNINDYKDVYKAMSKFTYDYYYNDVKTQSKTLADMKGNCTDLNQVERAALIELYGKDKVQIVRGLVKCNDGNIYGHVWCRIKVSGKWANIDASAAAKGKSLGSVICAKVVEITNINPSWAVSDDGRT